MDYGFEILNNETDFDFVRGFSGEFDINDKGKGGKSQPPNIKRLFNLFN